MRLASATRREIVVIGMKEGGTVRETDFASTRI